MTLLLSHDDVCTSVTMADAIEAMEDAFREQGEGAVTQPQCLNLKAGKGPSISQKGLSRKQISSVLSLAFCI